MDYAIGGEGKEEEVRGGRARPFGAFLLPILFQEQSHIVITFAEMRENLGSINLYISLTYLESTL